MKRRNPATDRAVRYLREYVISNGLKPGDRLPPLKALADKADVSLVSLWKAAQILRKERTLHSLRGHFLEVAAVPSALPRVPADEGPAETSRQLWEKIAGRVEADVLTGVFPPGRPLPPVKELRNRYAVSFPTLRKVMGRLISSGILTPHQRGYAVPAIRPDRPHFRLILLGYGEETSDLMLGEVDDTFFHIFETECSRTRILVDIVAFDLREGSPRFYDAATHLRREFPAEEDVLGYVYLLNRRLLFDAVDVLQVLAAAKKPVAIVDEVGDWTAPESVLKDPLIQVFTHRTSVEPARALARYLLALGHRRVGFVSLFHHDDWSKRRLHGFQSVFAAAGIPDGVIPFTYGRDDTRPEKLAWRCDIASAVRGLEKWNRDTPEMVRDYFVKVANRMRIHTASDAEKRCFLEPVFDRMLADRAITAWVAVNDLLGVMALDYLLSRNVKVPQRISVVSFDDNPQALRRRLTSFNFNAFGLANAVLNHLLKPPFLRKLRRRPKIEVPGMIVERRSSGKARGL